MHGALISMARFPKGGWDLQDYDSLSNWADDLEVLHKTPGIPSLCVSLRKMADTILDLDTVPNYLHDPEDDDDTKPDTASPLTSGAGKSAEEGVPKFVLNDPSVRRHLVSCFILC